MDRRIESIGLSLNMKCGNCNGPVHVPGLVRTLVCPHCAHKVPADWGGVERDLMKIAGQAAARSVGYKFFGKGGVEGRFDARRARPGCPQCEGEVDIAGLAPDVASVPCPNGHAVSVRPAEKMADTLLTGACWIVGEGLVIEAGHQTDRELQLIHCKACGGDVAIEPSKRDITCGYCSSLNYVPDEVWVRLHPELQPREFFVLAAWGDDELAAQEGALRFWHEKRPKKRKPLYKNEGELCRDWPVSERSGLDWLLATMSTEERIGLALEKNLPLPLVRRLVEDPKVPVRERIAENRSVPPEFQALLANDKHPNVIRRLAERDDLDPAVAITLIETGDPKLIGRMEQHRAPSLGMRLALARAGRTGPLEQLRVEHVTADELPLLAEAPQTQARVLAAGHPEADPELLARLASDPEVEVRRKVASRDALSAETVEALFRDADKKVRNAIRTRSDLPEPLLLEIATKDPKQLEALLQRDDCPPRAFELAVASNSKQVRRLLAAHDAVPEILLVALAEIADDDGVEKALAARERTPLLRAAMAASPAKRLREAVCADPLEPAQLDALAGDPQPSVRRRIASRPGLPDAVALVLADDALLEIAEAVAHHPAVARRRLRKRVLWGIAAVVLLGALGCGGLAVAIGAGLFGALS